MPVGFSPAAGGCYSTLAIAASRQCQFMYNDFSCSIYFWNVANNQLVMFRGVNQVTSTVIPCTVERHTSFSGVSAQYTHNGTSVVSENGAQAYVGTGLLNGTFALPGSGGSSSNGLALTQDGLALGAAVVGVWVLAWGGRLLTDLFRSK